MVEQTTMTLNLRGQFYPRFTRDELYGNEDLSCIQQAVDQLKSIETSEARPGMLLGKIQSGKTKVFLAIIALCFDNGFDVAIVLTKGTKALTRQTVHRVRREFADFQQQDALQIYDIMTVPGGLTGYELNQKLIFVAKKQSDNLDRLETLFRDTYPQLSTRRVLLIDDEADYASVGFRNARNVGLTANTTTHQIDSLRTLIRESAFLQVTATPYGLYLQPDEFTISGIEFKPVRPAFTVLVPVHPNYIGSDYYFEQSTEPQSVASFIYRAVGASELNVLKQPDRRRFRVEDCLTSGAIPMLRAALCNFIVGGIIRRLQQERAGESPGKFSFLVHTEAARAAHAWQEQIVMALNEKLTEAVDTNPALLRELLSQAYGDLADSVRVMNHDLPSLNDVIDRSFEAIRQGWLMITKVNSERQVDELLDDEGQLRLRTPLNIFIGGQILDRGITVRNLIGFFYGRRPQVYQQDTVLQHSRMFGFRPIQDLTVTRFYTAPQIHDAMRRMHESDVGLRDTITRNPDLPVVFIQRDEQGRIIPCSPNKVLLSNTTTLRPFKRILPIGFQSDYAVRTRPIISKIDRILADAAPTASYDEPFEITLEFALEVLTLIEPTLLMDKENGYEFDWAAARAALQYMSNASDRLEGRGRVWCLVRRDRNMSRFIHSGARQAYSDAPDTTHVEGRVARDKATVTPMLMLFRQNGKEQQGWRNTPFYWPVIWAPRDTRTTIFSNATPR